MSILEIDCVTYDIDFEKLNIDKIKTKTHEKNGVEYGIINYDSDVLCYDDDKLSLYRSIVYSKPEMRVLSFSPPKSIPNDTFQEKYPNITDKIYINEIIEGTMINLFYDKRIEKWELSTKGAVSANYFYYRNQYGVDDNKEKQKTFYRMFLDVFRASGNQELNDVQFLEELPKSYSYSFVLQHPDNHIVLNITEPKLYLVSVYIVADNNHIKVVPPTLYENWRLFCIYRGKIDFPKRYDEYNNYEKLVNDHCSVHTSHNDLGCMIVNMETGERTSIRNPTYENIKLLRGNNPNLQYQYLCLKRSSKVKDFLYYFPKYRKIFYTFYEEYNKFVTDIHQSYLTYYIQKQNIKIAKKYFSHIYKIHHELYLPSLQSETKLIVKRRVVQDYFERMEPREMLFHLNYDKRELSKEKKNGEE